MEKSKPVVVGIGELLWDVFPEVKLSLIHI